MATGCPRIRGGIPAGYSQMWRLTVLSPYTRGYSVDIAPAQGHDFVVPVHAGVFRR